MRFFGGELEVVGGVGCLGGVCGGARYDKRIHGARAVLFPVQLYNI